MCTCITYDNGDFYFGRNLDLEYSFGERVVVTPRNFPLAFKRSEPLSSHYAMIGMASVMDNYPMYAEAVNEKGLGMAGLNFRAMLFIQNTAASPIRSRRMKSSLGSSDAAPPSKKPQIY